LKVRELFQLKAKAKLEAWVEQDFARCAPLVRQVIHAVAQGCVLDAHLRSSLLLSYNFLLHVVAS